MPDDVPKDNAGEGSEKKEAKSLDLAKLKKTKSTYVPASPIAGTVRQRAGKESLEEAFVSIIGHEGELIQ